MVFIIKEKVEPGKKIAHMIDNNKEKQNVNINNFPTFETKFLN